MLRLGASIALACLAISGSLAMRAPVSIARGFGRGYRGPFLASGFLDARNGTFRLDLLYRLNVFPVQVPSLRERTDDIPLLAKYFIERHAMATGKRIKNIEKKTLDLFQAYRWPGNIRELQNVIERAVILCDRETLSVDESCFHRKHRFRSCESLPAKSTLLTSAS